MTFSQSTPVLLVCPGAEEKCLLIYEQWHAESCSKKKPKKRCTVKWTDTNCHSYLGEAGIGVHTGGEWSAARQLQEPQMRMRALAGTMATGQVSLSSDSSMVSLMLEWKNNTFCGQGSLWHLTLGHLGQGQLSRSTFAAAAQRVGRWLLPLTHDQVQGDCWSGLECH